LRCIYIFVNVADFLIFFTRQNSEMVKLLLKQKIRRAGMCLLLTFALPVMADEVQLAANESGEANNQHQATALLDNVVAAQQANAPAAAHKKIKKKPVSKKQTHHTHRSTTTTEASGSVNQNASPDAYNNTITPNFINNLPLDVDVPGQSFVSSGPYIGVPLAFSGSNLIINSPNINEDVALLNIRKAVRQRLNMLGRPQEADHAHLLLSGIVEAQAIYADPGQGPSTGDIDLTDVELDGYVLGPSSWTSALFAMTYDNNLGSREGAFGSNARVHNSRLFVSKAFIVIGDFSQSPIYGSIGQMYVPFGTYSTNMVSSPLTRTLGRIHERALLVGFQQQGTTAAYGAAYIFRGDSYTGATNRLDNGGVNLGYRFVTDKVSGNFGFGAVANLADSGGMQLTGNADPYWGGFGATNEYGNERISHFVPALNLRGLLSLGSHIDLLAEYIGAVKSFAFTDLTYNSHGARPQAFTVEGAYSFTLFDRPASVALGYGKSYNALGLGLALQRFSAVYNTSWWKDTLQSLEFRHDQNYAESATSTGSGTNITQVLAGTGKPDNTATAQFDIYF
jgi:hypothetical protein